MIDNCGTGEIDCTSWAKGKDMHYSCNNMWGRDTSIEGNSYGMGKGDGGGYSWEVGS